ncbi:hypothetical protein AYO39_02215 [Actinobacteria bacterium SCGC AG-212-D09]|nr:hypothetical protein AYO39_02215 [Actinobacteria bacterium SCGC AG-212-D09]
MGCAPPVLTIASATFRAAQFQLGRQRSSFGFTERRAASPVRLGAARETAADGTMRLCSAVDRGVELELKWRGLKRLVGRSRASALGPVRDHIMGAA